MFRQSIGLYPITSTTDGLYGFAEPFPFEEDENGLLIIPFPVEYDANGLIILDGYSWVPDPRPRKPLWRVDLCRGWERIGIVDAYKFRATTNRNRSGDFVLETSPQGVVGGNYFHPETGVPGPFDPRDVDTIRLVAEGRIVFPGYVAGDNHGLTISGDVNGERWRWTGIDAWWNLETRRVFPDPSTEPPWAVTHDVRTGVASTVITEYLNANMGSTALATREMAGFTVDDQLVGLDRLWSSRLQPLSELVSRIANNSGVEVIPEIGFDGSLNILLTAARDLSDFVVLSDQGDLLRSELRIIPTSATWTLTGGTGNGTARLFATSDTGATGADRLEQFSDQSSFDEADEVLEDAIAQNRLAAESYAVTTELTDTQAIAAIRFRLRPGDKLSVVVKGRRYRVPIETVTYDITPERQVVRPILGSAVPDEFTALLRAITGLENRFDTSIA